ncbi:MAG: DUF2529 domain-containing protein [Bacillus sp. (in: Bacteria)]|nr:DUF2529 domain-containing protein [Bacillus sp. (in: firmicutes)]
MKIFQTQLQGLITKLDKQEEVVEEAARMMAQSLVSDGKLWIFAEKEMKGILHQAVEGCDNLPRVEVAGKESSFSPMDSLLVFSPDRGSEEAQLVAETASENGTQVIGVSSPTTEDDNGWPEKCNFYLSTGIKGGLVPEEDGGRIGEPHLLVALYLYYSLFFHGEGDFRGI